MKKHIITIIGICLVANTCFGQYTTQIEILDEISSNKNDFQGNGQSISFSLMKVRNDSTNETKTFVSIVVSKEETTGVVKSTGVGINSNLDISLGMGNSQFKTLNTNSTILYKDDLEKINKFLASTLRYDPTKMIPNHSIGWTYTYKNLVFAILFDKNSYPNWKYYIRLNDSQFDISYDAGKKLIQKLVDFYNEYPNN